MDEHKREPLTDDQLSAIMKKWIVVAPESLENRVLDAHTDIAASKSRRSWWHFLLKGYVRVPTPVVCLVAILMIALVWRSTWVAATCTAGSGVRSAVSCPANQKC
ncbi:MAG TPA: hypothetical protein VKU01_10160 [Bryobacteraceae bacterium]|nr:hypothetical protein [Bryobacteraceae bacterium]